MYRNSNFKFKSLQRPHELTVYRLSNSFQACNHVWWTDRRECLSLLYQQFLPSMVITVVLESDCPDWSLALHLYFPASSWLKLLMTSLLTFPVVLPNVMCSPLFFSIILGTGLILRVKQLPVFRSISVDFGSNEVLYYFIYYFNQGGSHANESSYHWLNYLILRRS